MLATCLAADALQAQTTGRIDGRVSDPATRPFAGVRITATSTSLPGVQQTATDERGLFRLLALPPGDYQVRAELEGFHPVEQLNVRVPLGGSVVLDISLTPAFEEQITVPGRPPVIDATSAARGIELSSEVFDALPVARSSGVIVNPSSEGAIALGPLAPGVVPGPRGAPFVAGLALGENRYLVDGLDTTNPQRGSAGVSFPFEFVDEVEVNTGGYGPEYGGALAGVINVLTRSGGNQSRGDLFGYYRDQSAQAGEFGRASGFREHDYGIDAGGRLIRDRLWYFVAANPQSVETEKRSFDGRALEEGWDASRLAGKITWQASTAHRLNLSALGRDLDQDFREARAIGLHGSDRTQQSLALSLAWVGTFGSNLLVEAVGGRFGLEDLLHALDDAAPTYLDLTPGTWAAQQDCGGSVSVPELGEVWFHPGCVGGDTIVDPDTSTRDQFRASASWLSGRHELELGGSVIEQRLEQSQRFPGAFASPLVDAGGVEVDSDGLSGATFYLDPDSYSLEELATQGHPWSDEHALFVNDRFRPAAHVTMDLGIRADAYRSRVRETDGPQHELDFGLDDMIAPRLGVAWDFAHTGRSRLFAHVGRYYESMPLAASLLIFGRTTDVYHTFEYPTDGSLPTYTNPGVFLFSDYVISEPLPVVPGTQPTHTDEASVGVEYELRAGLAVGLNLVHRELGDIIETESFDEVFVVGNPGGSHTTNPATGDLLAEPADYDEPINRYRALELTLRRPLRDRWQLFGSYVYSESEGNYGAPGDHATPQFDFAELSEGSFGRLPGDHPHQLKAYGSYSWSLGLTFGFVGHYYSGVPISKLGFWPNLYERFVEPRGSAGRTPALWRLDLHLAYPVRLRGDDVRLELILDTLNVTDEEEVLFVDELWTFAEGEGVNPGECGGADPDCVNDDGDPVGNPHWGQPIAFQDGRNVRFGLKLRW